MHGYSVCSVFIRPHHMQHVELRRVSLMARVTVFPCWAVSITVVLMWLMLAAVVTPATTGKGSATFGLRIQQTLCKCLLHFYQLYNSIRLKL